MGLRSKMAKEAIKYTGKNHYPMILNIEISHTCNLQCKTCGRIKNKNNGSLTFEQCKEAIKETKAPIIYFTGGEPLLNKQLPEIVEYALKKDRIVFIVTNGVLLKDRIKEFKQNENLIFQVSIDGLKEQHNHIRGEGVFEKTEQGIKKAKQEGYNVYTNTTIYKTNYQQLEDIMQYFRDTVDGFYFMPMYSFFKTEEALNQEDVKKVGEQLLECYKKYAIANTIPYLEFLKGNKMRCTPWGTITLDPMGWKSPCYFIAENHYTTFNEIRERTEWDRYEKKKDKRCKTCFSNCGHEPTVVRDKRLLTRNFIKTII